MSDVAPHPDNEAPEQTPELEELLVRQVRRWLRRVAPELAANEATGATLELHVGQAGADDDGTLVLDWTWEERLDGPFFDDDRSGRVPGVKAGR